MASKLRKQTIQDRAKLEFAELLGDALKNGQRPEGAQPEKPWTDVAFSAALKGPSYGLGPGAVGTWRRSENSVTPTHVEPILDVLYGDKLPRPRAKLLAVWQRAKGIVHFDDRPEEQPLDVLLDWDDRTAESHVRGIHL